MSLILRTNLARPLTHVELDSNFTFLNITPWTIKPYLEGQFVIYELSGTTSLFYCETTHTQIPYVNSGNQFVLAYDDGTGLVTLWTRIGGTGTGGGGTYSAVSLTGATTGVTDIYAGQNDHTFQFKTLKSLSSDIVITHDNGTIYINSTAPTTRPFAQTITHNNVTCYGGANGAIQITATGGTGNRRYSVDGGSTWTLYSAATFKAYTGLTSGSYTVQIQDQTLGVLASQAVTVSQPNQLNYAFGTLGSTNVTVSGMTNGTVTVTATGGTTPYSFKLNSGTWNTPGTSSFTYTGLSAGTYTVLIQDANGCSPGFPRTATVTYAHPRMSLIGVNIGNPACHGGVGSLTVTISGGSGSYQYSIDGGAFGSTTSSTSGTFSGLAAGSSHYMSAKDIVSGQIINTTTVTIANPASLIFSTTGITNVSCGSGNSSISVKVKNAVGLPQIQFSGYSATTWFNMVYVSGTTYSFNTTGTTALTSYLNVPGTHTGIIKIKDTTCTTITGATSYNTHYYAAVSATASLTTAPSCPGDSWIYSLTANGGTGVYQYSLNSGSSWSSSVTGNTISGVVVAMNTTGVTATTKTILVRDSNNTGCSTSVNVNNSRITSLTLSIAGTSPSCSGGSGTATLTASGGRVDIGNSYQYQLATSGVTGTTLTLWQSSNVFTGLVAGRYYGNVRLNGTTTCTPGTSGSYFVTIPRPVTISLNTFSNPTACGGTDGSITVNVSGGTGQYQFSTNGGSTYNGTPLTPAGGTIVISTLGAGSYTILFKDTNNCVATGTFTKTLTAPSSPGFSVKTYTLPTCYGSNATVTLTATGGTAPYKFSSDGTTYSYAPSSGSTITYSVTPYTTPAKTYYVKDVHSCVQTTSVTGLGNVAQMTATLTVISGSTLQVTVANGVGSKSISLYSGTTMVYAISSVTSFPFNLGTYGTGTYYAVVTDTNGCSATSNSVAISPTITLYYFRYSLDGTAPNLYIEGGGNTYNIANSSNVYYDGAFATHTLAQVLSSYIGSLSTYGGNSVNLSTAAPTGWGSGSGTITMTYGSVGYTSGMAIVVPNIGTYTDLSTGTHLKAPPVTTPFNAAAKYIGGATIGGVNYSVYDVVAPTATVPSGTITTITIS